MTRVDVPASLPLADDETVRWSGRPRLSAAGPAALAGLVVAAVGIALGAVPAMPLRLPPSIAFAMVLLGIAIPAATLLSLVNTRYAVTDRAAYVKRGVVGRRVSRARLSMVENTAYAQSVTGSLFGYGTVELQTAGTSFAFRRVDDPAAVRAIVDEHAGGSARPDDSIPGRVDEWRAVREEIRRLRAAFERRADGW